nr:MAG TPA: tail tape measure protein [Caudoviricetes sp.]
MSLFFIIEERGETLLEVFKILGKIAIKNDEAKKSLNETSETAEKTQSKLSRIFQSIGRSAIKNNSEISESNANTGKSLSQIAAESGKTVNQLKSDVGKAAAEYRKQGMSASEAMKKAYADIGYVAGETHKKVDKHLDKTGKKTVDIKAKMKSMFSAIGKGALTSVKALAKVSVAAAKIGVVAATVVATGLTAMTKSAVEQYADYEQLVGGVETLFKDSSDKVVEYANNAYKTAGLSANEYMDTVTSFSASLLQGLGGDTEKAAETANLAITDMSDNANKMGTDMASIQNAYQGFAKQNYTMLDNLKLGYGGTASEMARLINDSGVLGDSMTVTADNVNSVSFDKMIEAIHVVQTDMGITGTTAKEAATTIQGSIGMMKSAWTNLLTGMADPSQDMGVLINNLVDSVMAVADNLVPRIADTLPRIVTGISSLAQKLAPYIPPLIEQILPSLIQGATSLLSELVNNLPGILETLLPGIGGELGQTLTSALQSIFETFQAILPTILSLVNTLLPPLLQIVQTILPPLTNLINMLLPPIVQIVSQILPILISILQPVLELLQPILDLLNPIINLILMILDPLMELINMILPPLVEVISLISEEILGVLKPILEWFCEILEITLEAAIIAIMAVINNCRESFSMAWKGIKKVWNAAPAFFKGIWNGIKSAFAAVGKFFKGIFTTAWNGIKSVWSAVTGFFSGIWNGIKGIFSSVGTWFSGIFGKAWAGIKNAFSPMVKFFSDTWQKIKNIFSKVGTAIADGIKGAVTAAINGILGTATKIINGFISAINACISVINAIPGVSINKLDKLNAPQLAEGGVLKKGQVGILEGNGAEAVVPLEKNTEWISKVADQMSAATGRTVDNESELSKVLYLILDVVRHIDENMYEYMVRALTEGTKLKIDGREFGRMVRTYA